MSIMNLKFHPRANGRLQLAVALFLGATLHLPAAPAETPPPAPVALNEEQQAAFVILDAMLDRFEQLLGRVGDARVKTDTTAVLESLKVRRDALRADFDSGRHEELRLDVNTEAQRIAIWLAPLRTPPRPVRAQ